MKQAKQIWTRAAVFGLLATSIILTGDNALAQASYPSPEAAADAFVSSLATGDDIKLKHVLGADFKRYVPPGAITQEDIYTFLAAWSKHHEVVMSGPTTATFIVGQHDWSFPAPLIKGIKGWHFDVREGGREMLRRRMNRHEEAAIHTLQDLCDAQEQYRSSVGQGKPAQRIVSREGQYDGLYWESDVQAPVQSLLTDDALVMGTDVPVDAALHGYRYTILPSTGDQTGCAFAAWPAAYGSSGEYSFLIGSGGKVMERDLGKQSSRADFSGIGRGTNAKWTPVVP